MYTYYTNHCELAQQQMEEFIELIKEKTEAEYAKAEAMAKLSEFPLDKLKDSPFEEVANAIKRRA